MRLILNLVLLAVKSGASKVIESLAGIAGTLQFIKIYGIIFNLELYNLCEASKFSLADSDLPLIMTLYHSNIKHVVHLMTGPKGNS